jgi:hypothetical protein
MDNLYRKYPNIKIDQGNILWGREVRQTGSESYTMANIDISVMKLRISLPEG